MEFRILGHFEVRHDDRLVEIGARRLQTLLATLILKSNAVVPSRHLIDDVWSGRPPKTAKSALQAYVYRLRRLLPDSSEAAIRTVQGGYILEVVPAAVDLHRFHAAIAQGRHDLGEGNTTAGVARMRAGLAMWRGDALADMFEEHLQAEARRLNDLRITVLEETLHAELALGRHDQVVLELDGLVTAHPYRERLWKLLMLALYRSERQSDALAIYDRARRTMVDGLGIEPGAELRQLQREILNGIPAAGAPAKIVSVLARPVAPAELPADITAFTGRGTEQNQLRQLLTAQPRRPASVVVVGGPVGIGKSALAVHTAHGLANHFPDGILYANLQGTSLDAPPLAAAAVLRRWLYYFGVGSAEAPTNVEEAAALFRSLISGRRILLVLDNVASASQVRPLLPASLSCRVVVTTRRTLATFDNVAQLRLRPLPEDDAVELLARLIDPNLARHEPQALTSIARLCGYLPLALRIAGARLAAQHSWRASDLAHRLANDRQRLNELAHADLNLRAAFQVSHRQLASDAVGRRALHLFGLLGMLHSASFDARTAQALAQKPLDCTEGMLDRLIEVQLLERAADGTYRIPDLVRLFAREWTLAEIPRCQCQTGS